MDTQRNIAAPQFFVMMFVVRAAGAIALNGRALGGDCFTDSIPSCLLAAALGLVIALPVLLLDKKYPGLSVGEAAAAALGPMGKAVPLFYIAYFILTGAGALGLFHIFLREAVNPEFSSALTAALLLGAALYGAFRGLETVARCAVCVFAFLVLGAALVFGIVSFRFAPENLEPLFYHGGSQTVQSALLFIGRTSVFADMAVLLPRVKGKKGRGFLLWAGGTAAFGALLLFLLQGCLGPYAATQAFPLHALSSLTEIRSMQRLDAVFVGVWMLGLVVRLACEIYACRVCFAACSGRRKPVLSVALSGFLILLLSYAVAGNEAVRALLLDRGLLFWCTLFVGLLLPLVVLLALKFRQRREKE